MGSDYALKSDQMAQQLNMQGINNQQRATEGVNRSIGQGTQMFVNGVLANRQMGLANRQQDLQEQQHNLSVGAQFWRQQMGEQAMQQRDREIDSKIATDAQLREQAQVRTQLLQQQLQLKGMMSSQEMVDIQKYGQLAAAFKSIQDAGLDPMSPAFGGMFKGMVSKDGGAEFPQEDRNVFSGIGVTRKNGNYFNTRNNTRLSPEQVKSRLFMFKKSEAKEEEQKTYNRKQNRIETLRYLASGVDRQIAGFAKQLSAWLKDPMNMGKSQTDFENENPQLVAQMVKAQLVKSHLDNEIGALVGIEMDTSLNAVMKDVNKSRAKRGEAPVDVPNDQYIDDVPFGQDHQPAPAQPAQAKKPQQPRYDPYDTNFYGETGKSPMFVEFLKGRASGKKPINPEDLLRTRKPTYSQGGGSYGGGMGGGGDTEYFAKWRAKHAKGLSRRGAELKWKAFVREHPLEALPEGYYFSKKEWQKAFNQIDSLSKTQHAHKFYARKGRQLKNLLRDIWNGTSKSTESDLEKKVFGK